MREGRVPFVTPRPQFLFSMGFILQSLLGYATQVST